MPMKLTLNVLSINIGYAICTENGMVGKKKLGLNGSRYVSQCCYTSKSKTRTGFTFIAIVPSPTNY